MNEIIRIAQNGNNLVKSLILMILAVPVTFFVQLLFYLIIHIWIKTDKSEKKDNIKK